MVKTDRRILKTQLAIKNALVTLMTEKDFEKITVKDICRVANVGNRTFYLHYFDKYDLQDKLIADHMQALRSLCQPQNTISFKAAHLIWFKYLKDHQQFFSTMLKGPGALTFRKYFLALIIEQLKHDKNIFKGQNTEIDEGLILTFFGSAIIGVAEDYLLHDAAVSIDVIASQLSQLLERNI
ncbi:TetR family transcriptional regulator [Lactobacillus sp. CBA3605]|uniref:TetR/AcrR family transcriptional regulator n=1 Tax=Lactobacillus sp. CBA3605 TaxID=2099788 RepID=UPI000CFD3CAB|nr:TetR/AcrR family transcriptional regulator [Lactobacillus sp. CBA3605]AVK62209.1 TetR family transcriptional regulator [Lactobacillus sp. CBA3605]